MYKRIPAICLSVGSPARPSFSATNFACANWYVPIYFILLLSSSAGSRVGWSGRVLACVSRRGSTRVEEKLTLIGVQKKKRRENRDKSEWRPSQRMLLPSCEGVMRQWIERVANYSHCERSLGVLKYLNSTSQFLNKPVGRILSKIEHPHNGLNLKTFKLHTKSHQIMLRHNVNDETLNQVEYLCIGNNR